MKKLDVEEIFKAQISTIETIRYLNMRGEILFEKDMILSGIYEPGQSIIMDSHHYKVMCVAFDRKYEYVNIRPAEGEEFE